MSDKGVKRSAILTVTVVAAIAGLLLFARFMPTAAAARAGIVVTTLIDDTTVNGNCSLREAVAAANENIAVDNCTAGSLVTADRITFARDGTILLSDRKGELVISETLVIEGNGRELTIIDGQSLTRIINVGDGSGLTLRALTLQNGYAGEDDGGGGAILNNAGTFSDGPALTLEDVLVQHSVVPATASGGGGVMSIGGNVVIADSEISNNNADGASGGGLQVSYGSLHIDNTIVRNNSAQNGDGIAKGGGGIFFNVGVMTATRTIIENNNANGSGAGGGLWAAVGSATIISSLISNNSAIGAVGGGIYGNLELTLLDSSISDNIADNGSGGGLALYFNPWRIERSTISGNSSVLGQGGGVFAVGGGTLMLMNSTVSHNNASRGEGHAVYLDADATIAFGTIVSNSAPLGFYGVSIQSGSVATFTNSIVAGNTPQNCFAAGTIQSTDFNISDDTSCGLTQSNDQQNVDPLLGALQDNGGPTETHAITALSPAFDGGQCVSGPDVDQRGVLRPQGRACDVGAFELETAPTAVRVARLQAGAGRRVWLGIAAAILFTACLLYGTVATAQTQRRNEVQAGAGS